MWRWGVVSGLTLSILVCAASASLAQEPSTREEAEWQRREEKNRALQPYKPSGFEKAMHFVEEKAIFIIGREGLYPKLGSLTTGSGFAYGVGFRDRDLLNNTGQLDLWAATSTRMYWATEARLTFPKLANNHLLFETWAAHRDYPEEDFFGLGPDSARSDRTNYAIRSDLFGARAGVRPFPILLAGGGAEYLNPRLSEGQDTSVPSIEDLFDPTTAPGLGESVDYLRTMAFVELDYREPKNARKGGWYRVSFSHFDDRTTGLYTFDRVDTDLRQFIGFLAGRRVIAARLFISTSNTDAGHLMPFYSMPTLGGNDTLRGFREYRFRGPHAILVQGEYRWEIWSGFDAALFYDAGKVANTRSDLDFENLETDYGIGFRFNTNEAIVFRVDAGFGSRDGKHLYIVFGGVF
ncbi:MAG TPA: BamA/TamA family outer membrane protein [Vicinamibacterales bacterium]|nr:BamA/TamA family outer membrane protein [Vicinamibacterales bacterium]